jgi:hypothetical protein
LLDLFPPPSLKQQAPACRSRGLLGWLLLPGVQCSCLLITRTCPCGVGW